jgi:hypothetical protein
MIRGRLTGGGRARSCALYLAMVAAAVSIAPAHAHAARGSSFTLEPLTATNELGYFLLDAPRRGPVRAAVRVRNVGGAAGRVRLYVVDADTADESGIVYLNRLAPRRDIGRWTHVAQRTLRLAPGASRVVRLDVDLPRGTRAGDHVGAVIAEDARTRSAARGEEGDARFEVQVRQRRAVAIHARVPGPRAPRLQLHDVVAAAQQDVQEVRVAMANGGNTLVRPHGSVRVTDAEGRRVLDRDVELEPILPGDAIRYPVRISGRALGEGTYEADVRLRYGNRAVRLVDRFSITAEDVARSFPQTVKPPAAAPGSPLALALILALGVLTLLMGAYIVRTRRS